MHRVLAVCAVFLMLTPALTPAQTDKSSPTYAQPAPNLVIILSDIKRHLEEDVYRFPYPTDITGQNVFRAALVRLANHEKLYPKRDSDIIALAKAQAWERLCAFREAGLYYQEAQKSDAEPIRRLAGEGFERAKQFSAAADVEIDQSSLRIFEQDMRQRIGTLGELAREYRGTPYECLALVARERAQMQMGEFYVSFRFMSPYSTKDAEAELKRNIDVNKDSKLRFAHHLRLGDFYFDRAREYTLKNDPEGTGFDVKAFESFTRPARAEYKLVEEADGYPEKLEGRAKLLALEAFTDRVRDRAR